MDQLYGEGATREGKAINKLSLSWSNPDAAAAAAAAAVAKVRRDLRGAENLCLPAERWT